VPRVTRSGWERRCQPRAPRPSALRRSSSLSGAALPRDSSPHPLRLRIDCLLSDKRPRSMRRMAVPIQPPPNQSALARTHPERLEAGLSDPRRPDSGNRRFRERSRAYRSELRVERFALLTMPPAKRTRARNDLGLVVPTPPRLFTRDCVLVGQHREHARPPAVPTLRPRGFRPGGAYRHDAQQVAQTSPWPRRPGRRALRDGSPCRGGQCPASSEHYGGAGAPTSVV
jgi:hypothetical protein